MNSLKVIDEEIKYWQKTINTARSEKSTQKIIVSLNPLYKVENAILSDYEILLIEEKLQTLQQIKSELEAWKVLKSSKRYTMYNKDIDTGIIMKKITFIFEDKGDDCIVKKALEVKEDD